MAARLLVYYCTREKLINDSILCSMLEISNLPVPHNKESKNVPQKTVTLYVVRIASIRILKTLMTICDSLETYKM